MSGGNPGRGVFRSLTIRNFRLFVAGQVLSVTGTWMMVVAQDWLVLALTDDSGLALGLVTATQFGPMLLLTLYGGKLADRYDKRMLLGLCNAASAVGSLGLAVLVLGGAVRLWHVFAFALFLGIVNSVEVPTRMSFVGEMVGPGLLPNASALSAAYFNLARVAGPAMAGLVISAFGVGPVVAFNAASYTTVLVCLRLMRPAEFQAPVTRQRGGIRDGLRHVRDRPDLVTPLLLVLLVSVFALNFQLTLPLLAKNVFHTDARSFGLLTAAFSFGSLCAALVTATRTGRPSSRVVVVSAAVFGLFEIAAGLSPGFPAAAALLAATGCASVAFGQAANHRVQLGTEPGYRGRVLAVYTLIMQGSTPVGALIMGWIISYHGVRAGLVLGGAVALLATLVASALERRRAPDISVAPRPAEWAPRSPDPSAASDRASGRSS
ncbi:MFS transporter [Streptomyces sp. NPDC057424]|uniref:MFS transporter n=1 Tax=Streptomyces sp. NPDC057424 TaxID=3346127 RepID=UPI0036C864FD